MEELMELIEQCEAEEGIVSKPLQPLSSMPTISPLSRRKKRHNSDTSSVTSSDESLSEVFALNSSIFVTLVRYQPSTRLACLHAQKKRFFSAVRYERFFFLLTQGEKRAFSQLKAFISA